MDKAIDILRHQLTLPICPDPQQMCDEYFDPWAAFPSLYGSYSSEFDDMAIEVLESIAGQEYRSEPLSHQMFREMLCTAGLCEYGTSPRTCFPDYGTKFADILPVLIEKWNAYRAAAWTA